VALTYPSGSNSNLDVLVVNTIGPPSFTSTLILEGCVGSGLVAADLVVSFDSSGAGSFEQADSKNVRASVAANFMLSVMRGIASIRGVP
jgi:hypothetical protein